jgi:hypothetical protein
MQRKFSFAPSFPYNLATKEQLQRKKLLENPLAAFIRWVIFFKPLLRGFA